MGCLKLINENHKGKEVKMSKSKDEQIRDLSRKVDEMNKMLANMQKNPIEKFMTSLQGQVTILVAILGAATWIYISFNDVNQNIVALQKDISYLSEDIEKIQSSVDELNYDMYDSRGRISQLVNQNALILSAYEDETGEFALDITISDNNISNTATSFTEDTPIGTDSNGNVYIAQDLVGKTILLTYYDKTDNKEVYFLGQYSENYHWDGFCITNAYNLDGTLYGICESNFEDGKRIDYRTFICSSEEENTWWYYDRKCNGSVNEGISVKYAFKYDKIKSFTNKNVRFADILYTKNFTTSQEVEMTKYYCGNTSNGTYNDNTGNAYYVEYSNGYVKILYCGNFVNGRFDDSTGNAWYITKDDNAEYAYYKGKFEKGEALNNAGSEFKKPITKEQILEIIQDKKFDCLINWN